MNTRRCLLISLALFSYTILSNAQQPTLNNSAQSPTPAPLREYLSPEGRFKVLLCEKPEEVNETVDSASGKLAVHQLVCPSTPAYSVTYVDYPFNLETADLVKKTLDKARDGGLAGVAKEDPRITLESDISIDGHPGRFFQIELKGDAIVRTRCAIVGNRIYVISVGSPKQKPQVVDATNDYEGLAASFLNSFKTIPQ